MFSRNLPGVTMQWKISNSKFSEKSIQNAIRAVRSRLKNTLKRITGHAITHANIWVWKNNSILCFRRWRVELDICPSTVQFGEKIKNHSLGPKFDFDKCYDGKKTSWKCWSNEIQLRENNLFIKMISYKKYEYLNWKFQRINCLIRISYTEKKYWENCQVLDVHRLKKKF